MVGSCLTFVYFFITGIWATVSPQKGKVNEQEKQIEIKVDPIPNLSKIPYHNVAREEEEIYHFFFGAKNPAYQLRATGKDNYTSVKPRDLSVTLKYPSDPRERGRYVYCLKLDAKSDADKITAKVVEGGIGQDNIKVKLEATSFRKLEYNISVEASGTRVQPFIFPIATILVIIFRAIFLNYKVDFNK